MDAIGSMMGAGAPATPLFNNPQDRKLQREARRLELKLAALIALAQVGAGANGNSAQGMTSSIPSFGGVSNGNGIGSFLGAGAAAPPGASSSAGGGSGSGQAAVDLARKFQGQDSSSIKGKMPKFTAAGGVTNNCADFVSAALESQGLIKGHHINVKSMEQELKKQGYVQVPAQQARPGDVWISDARSHTELVATKGATKLIGSNNNGDSRQEITEHENRGGGIIYQKR